MQKTEFAAFSLSDSGRQVMTSNKLSIHVDSGEIFYENHNARENFYNFLIAQQNEEAAFIPKIFSCKNSFEGYICQFLLAFPIDDVEKSDLFAHKNAKYLFYWFSDYVKAYGNHKLKIRHTRKLGDSVGMQKIEDKSKQILIAKLSMALNLKIPTTLK